MDLAVMLAIVNIIIIPGLLGLWKWIWALNKRFDDLKETFDTKNTSSYQVVFRRMDENKEEYYKNFLRKDIYDEILKGHEEKINQRFLSSAEILNLKLENINAKIDNLRPKTGGKV